MIFVKSSGDQFHEIAAWSPDGRSIAFLQQSSVKLWSIGKGLIRILHTKQFAFLSLAVSLDGAKLIAGNIDNSISILGQESSWSNKSRLEQTVSSTSSITSLDYSPSQKLFASGDRNGLIRIWDAKTGRAVGRPLDQEEEVKGIAYNPKGRIIASVSRSGLFLWDLATRRLIGAFSGGGNSLAVNPDGKSIAVAGSDGKLRRWVASPSEWFRLSCARLAHHPLLRDPASVSTDPEVVAAGKRVRQACRSHAP